MALLRYYIEQKQAKQKNHTTAPSLPPFIPHANPSPDLEGHPIMCRCCTPPQQPSPRGDVGLGGGGTLSSSAKIQRFSQSPHPLAPSTRWALRASSSPSPCLRWPPNPPLSAASSQASPPIPNASVIGRLLFFAIAGHHGCRCHRLPRPHPPSSPSLVVLSPPPPAPSLAHPLPPDNAFLPRTPRDVLLAQRDAD